MKFMVKALDSKDQEYDFENTFIGEDKDITFYNEKAAEIFIEGLRISLPPIFQYRIIPIKEDVEK